MCNNFLSLVSSFNPTETVIDCSLASKILNEKIGLNLIMESISLSGLRGENLLIVKIPLFIKKEWYPLEHEAPKSYDLFKGCYNAVSEYYEHKTYSDTHIKKEYDAYLKRRDNNIEILNFNHKQKFIPTNLGTIVFIPNEFRTLNIKYNKLSEELDLRRYFSFSLNYY